MMGAGSQGRVLDVGQCEVDHSSIRSVIEANFAVDVDRARSVDDALEAMRRQRYDLVLVNRIIFADGCEGMELIRQARQDPALADVPMMLVSNYVEAQAEAVAAGAQPGFGKAGLHQKATVERLAEFLPAKVRSA